MGCKSEACPVCHLIVAPFDPERVEYRELVAHGSCLQRSELLVRHALHGFLDRRAGLFTSSYIERLIRVVSGRRALADLVERALKMVLREPRSPSQRVNHEDVRAFAARMSGLLFEDIDV